MPKPKPQEDNSAWGGGLLKGLVNVAGLVAAPFTGGASIAAAQGVNAIGDAAHESKLKAEAGAMPKPVETVQASGGDAIARKYAQMQAEPSNQFLEAESALSRLPPEMQEQYGPVLSQAKMASMKRTV